MTAPWFVWFAAWVISAIAFGLLVAAVVSKRRGEEPWWAEDKSELDLRDEKRHNGRPGI